MLPFALNHMTTPKLGWEAFLSLAADLGCVGVEFRNDLPGALFGGADPATVGVAVKARGLRFLALAEVKMFNDWSDAKAAEAEALMKIAVAAGAEAISLIPRNDNVATDRADSRRVTETALREILPMLRAHGLKAMVEPLGFAVCSLRYKDVLADAIGAVGGEGMCFMVHDTFHHALAGFGPIFPELTGIVHVSGVKDMIALDNMRDQQTAYWSPDQVQSLMTNWLSTGAAFDGVLANNDEMAIGALQAMKATGVDMASVIVSGVDATQDALASMQAGELDITVFQNAAAQGGGALDAAVKLSKGEAVEQKVYIPFELVTPANVADYASKN